MKAKPDLPQETLLATFHDDAGVIRWKIRPPRSLIKPGDVAGRVKGGYHYIKFQRKEYIASRVLWVMRHGPIPAGMLVDHKDGNTLNNKEGNLRLVTPAQNNHNRRLNSRNKSGEPGVCWNKQYSKWEVRVMRHGYNRFGGLHTDLDFAIKIAREMRAEMHGDFSILARGSV